MKKLAASVRNDDNSISSLQEDESNKLRVSCTTHCTHILVYICMSCLCHVCMCMWSMQEIEAFEAAIDELREKRMSIKKKLDDQVIYHTYFVLYTHAHY